MLHNIYYSWSVTPTKYTYESRVVRGLGSFMFNKKVKVYYIDSKSLQFVGYVHYCDVTIHGLSYSVGFGQYIKIRCEKGYLI